MWKHPYSAMQRHVQILKHIFTFHKDAWPWKKRPLGCLLAASDMASHTTVSAPWASVRSLFFIFAWKSGMDDCTAVDETQNNIFVTETARFLYQSIYFLAADVHYKHMLPTWGVCPAWVHGREVDFFVLSCPLLCHGHLLPLRKVTVNIE